MGQVYIQASKCPMCGGDIKQYARECQYCGSTLIVIGVEKTFLKDLDLQMLDSAMVKWKEILKYEPNSAEANYALGLIYLNKKLHDQALQHLRKASVLAPENAVIHYNLALTLFNDGKVLLSSFEYQEAIKEIDYAIKLDSNFSEAFGFKHFFLARKLDSIDRKEAIREYNVAIAECPDIATFHNNLGLCYMLNSDYFNAEICYRKALELDPNFLMAHINFCHLSFLTGKNQEGVIYGKKAIQLLTPAVTVTSKGNAYNNLALCLWKTGQKQEAIKHINKAIAFCPANSLYKDNLRTIGATGCACLAIISLLGLISLICLFIIPF